MVLNQVCSIFVPGGKSDSILGFTCLERLMEMLTLVRETSFRVALKSEIFFLEDNTSTSTSYSSMPNGRHLWMRKEYSV